MTDRELMQQALEALEVETAWSGPTPKGAAVITALRERLAQPEPAPGYCQHCKQYTIEEPLPAQPEQEPVAWRHKKFFETQEGWFYADWHPDGINPPSAQLLYTAPPRREWKGLTEEEIEQVCVPLGAAMLSFIEVARAIEAKLREKNA